MRVAKILFLPLCLAVAGCAIPREGALTYEFTRPTADANYVVRPIDEALVLRSQGTAGTGLPAAMRDAPAFAPGILAPGDRLALTIIEGAAGAVPSIIGGRLDLERLDVTSDGSITVPYAGTIQAAGREVGDVQQAIQQRLVRKLYMPQVQLRVVEEPGKSVSIVGAVGKGGAFPLGSGLTRLADLVGAAGVTAEHSEQVRLEVRRGETRGQISLKELLEHPEYNVALQPNDVVMVSKDLQYVTTMGAVKNPGRVEIAGQAFSLLDALSQSRGLDPYSADPGGVFLFRNAEQTELPGRAVVYRIDIRDPMQVMLARQLRMGSGDLVYVSTASFAQTTKVLSSISSSLVAATRVVP